MIIIADKFTLLDNLEIPATGPLQINGEFVADVAEYLRGLEIEVFDRNNDRTEITFSTTRLHASVSEAEQFCLDHRRLVPRICLISLISDWEDGTRVERFLQNAAIPMASSRTGGATSYHSYTIIGGLIKTKQELK